ncbi:MAG: hypothetical protein GY932_09510 [Arcobacter sp.]|nr:hypothetical protein [Arcobacter sp.]
MQKTIKKLRKKLKTSQKLCSKLENEIIEYHNDIIIFDKTNFNLEQENTHLLKKISDYEEVYLKNTKTAFEKQLQHIMSETRDIKKEDNSFYSNAIKYMYGYIKALEQYSNGDVKAIMKKIQNYKTQIKESKKSLHEIKYGKKSIFKKIDKVSKDMKGFKKRIEKSI